MAQIKFDADFTTLEAQSILKNDPIYKSYYDSDANLQLRTSVSALTFKSLYQYDGADDTINVSSINKDNMVLAGAGNDVVVNGGGNDFIDGGAGNDSINAGGAFDTIIGGLGNDTIHAGTGNDKIYGNEGNDLLAGNCHIDTYYGGAGADTFALGTTDNDLFASKAYERAVNFLNDPNAVNLVNGQFGVMSNNYLGANASVRSDVSARTYDDGDYIMDFEKGVDKIHMQLGAYNNIVKTTASAADAVRHGTAAGPELGTLSYWFEGGYTVVQDLNGIVDLMFKVKGNIDLAKTDFMWGNGTTQLVGGGVGDSNGDGNDVLTLSEDFREAPGTGSVVNGIYTYHRGLDNMANGGAGNDLIHGTGGTDYLLGGAGADTLNGNNFIDALFGGAGNDKLVGGAWQDLLYGGAGSDVFAYNSWTESYKSVANPTSFFDRVMDFGAGDKIAIAKALNIQNLVISKVDADTYNVGYNEAKFAGSPLSPNNFFIEVNTVGGEVLGTDDFLSL